MGTLMRGSAAIAQRRPAAFLKPSEPFITGLATDPVSLAQLGHRVQGQPIIPNESFSLFHGCCLQPGHPPTSGGPQPSECHPCSRFNVLPMYPVCTKVPPNHALQAAWNPAQFLASLAMPSRLYLEHTLVLGSSG